MSRQYTKVSEYEQEILKLKQEGKTHAQIAQILGLADKEVIKRYFARRNEKQRKIDAGIQLHKKGRPAKDSLVSENDKISVLKYQLSRKDARIKQLEMENELMRDFLSETGRK